MATVKTNTIELSPFGYPMELEYEWILGEPAIMWPTEHAHPGSASSAVLVAVRVGGHDIYNELRDSLTPYLEEEIRKAVEQ